MNNHEFYEEIDRLVEKGETNFPEYDLDIEAFHHLNAIKAQNKRSKFMNGITGVVLFFIVGAIVIYFVMPEWLPDLKKNALNHSGKQEAIQREVLFDSLLSENLQMKNTIAELRSQINEKGEVIQKPKKIFTQDDTAIPGLIYHVVKRGETLFSLAKQYYGSGSMSGTLMEDNGISNPSELAVGMTLVIHNK